MRLLQTYCVLWCIVWRIAAGRRTLFFYGVNFYTLRQMANFFTQLFSCSFSCTTQLFRRWHYLLQVLLWCHLSLKHKVYIGTSEIKCRQTRFAWQPSIIIKVVSKVGALKHISSLVIRLILPILCLVAAIGSQAYTSFFLVLLLIVIILIHLINLIDPGLEKWLSWTFLDKHF